MRDKVRAEAMLHQLQLVECLCTPAYTGQPPISFTVRSCTPRMQ